MTLQSETIRLAAELIRIDSTNTGDDSTVGERQAAEYVMAELTDVGYDPVYLEPRPRRANLVLRVEGQDSARPPLLLHGHLDVVPALASEWRFGPFSGEIAKGCLWGRGAVDMKDMDGMLIALLRDMKLTGWRPSRDLIVAFLADEEAGSREGVHWIVDHRPELLQEANQAIGEVGGFSTTIGQHRAYLVQTAEKGLTWLRLIASGQAGHGSAINQDNAVAKLAACIGRLTAYQWPRRLHPAVAQLLQGVAELSGLPPATDQASLDRLLDALGPARTFVAPTLSTSLNPTSLTAGGKVNVIPSRAEATIDLRQLPGSEAEVAATLAELAGPDISIGHINQGIGVSAPIETELTAAMTAALQRADPQACVLPYMLCAGTDAKGLSRLGIDCYGFVPLQLPAGFDFPGKFHGVDECVPLTALEFGVTVLKDLLTNL